jgi:dipeptidyl-peptidase-4
VVHAPCIDKLDVPGVASERANCQLAVGDPPRISIRAEADGNGRETRNRVLKEVESRLRRIYDRREFRAKNFRADWLSDSSGYTVREPVPGDNEKRTVRYEAANRKRTVLKSPRRGKSVRSGTPSPDGQRVLYFDKGNLHVQDINGGRTISLTKNTVGRSVSIGNARWSPDGNRIAYVQSDYSRVRLRAVLTPGDPSYPNVRKTRFARVGETIPALQVGVVACEGGDTQWLSIPAHAEGFYLEQVDWAESSDKLLVEQLSRFRDKRVFLMANIHTGTVTPIYSESDPAWVIASIRKNVGIEWIRNGRAFIVLSEKDGWRHAYVCSRDGKEQVLLTPGASDIIERVKVDEAHG